MKYGLAFVLSYSLFCSLCVQTFVGCKAVGGGNRGSTSRIEGMTVEASKPSVQTPADVKEAAAEQVALSLVEGVDKKSDMTPPDLRQTTNAVLGDIKQEDFIRSCVVTAGEGEYCIQNKAEVTLQFCAGVPSKVACDSKRYARSCSRSVPSYDSNGKVSSVQKESLVIFLSQDLKELASCDQSTVRGTN